MHILILQSSRPRILDGLRHSYRLSFMPLSFIAVFGMTASGFGPGAPQCSTLYGAEVCCNSTAKPVVQNGVCSCGPFASDGESNSQCFVGPPSEGGSGSCRTFPYSPGSGEICTQCDNGYYLLLGNQVRCSSMWTCGYGRTCTVVNQSLVDEGLDPEAWYGHWQGGGLSYNCMSGCTYNHMC